MFRKLLTGAAAAVAVIAVASSAGAAEFKLRIQSHYAPETPSGKLAQ